MSSSNGRTVAEINVENFLLEKLKDKYSNNKITTKSIYKEYESHSTKYSYLGFEREFARYTLSKLLQNHPGCLVSDSRNLSNPPTTTTIDTDYNERTKIVNNVLIGLNNGTITGMDFPQDNLYIVNILAKTEDDLNNLTREYTDMLESSNFYTGKCLKFEYDGPKFFLEPTVKFSDVILKEDILKDYKLNTVEFLTNTKLQIITKKRAVILSGPPGVGKTSLTSATMNACHEKGITSAFLTSDSFRKMGLDSTFNFINKYLTPALICFEDIDLIGQDRNHGNNSMIGPLLSILNGLEEFNRPIVILATTNRFEILDSAVTRPCRFDRHFAVNYPEKKELNGLFKKFFGIDAPDKILEKQGKITGAHIQEIYSTSRLLATCNSGDIKAHIEEATETVFKNFYLSNGNKIGFTADQDLYTEDAPQLTEASKTEHRESTFREANL